MRDIAPNQKALAAAILANALIGVNDLDGAIKALEEVVKLRRHSDDWLLLGQCQLQKNQPQKALDALKQAEAIRPDRPDVHKSLSDAYQLLGKSDKAREHAETHNRLIDLQPKSP
jgi:tetratricopeptide (TPR) repeat protein